MDYIDIVGKFSDELADKTGFSYADDDRNVCELSLGEFATQVRKAATYIVKNGYIDEVIAFVGDNNVEWIIGVYGALYTATSLLPLNPRMEKDNIIHVLTTLGVKLVVTDSQYYDMIAGLNVAKTITFDEFLATDEELAGYNIQERISNLPADKVRVYMCSSGTTGKEKIVMLSTKNIMAPLLRAWETATNPTTLKFFWTMPFYHIGFLSFSALLMGGNMLCINRSPKYCFKDILLMQPNAISAAPMLCSAVTKKLERGIALEKILGDNCKMMSCGSAVLRPETIKSLLDNGCFVGNSYGLTESSSMGTTNIITMHNISKMESVGPAKAGAQLIIKDGEILIGGDCVMLGYYGDEELTNETIKDGWLYTGDLGYIDEDGYLYIKGRKKNIIITEGGENVIAEELEAVFIKQNLVEEVCVYSSGNAITAEFYIGSMNTSTQQVEEAVKAYNKECPRHKLIRNVKFRDAEFEKTGTGKIKRRFDN